MRTVSRTSSVHSHVHIIQREGRILTSTNRHPAPFSGIGSRTDSIHNNVNIFEGQSLSPQSNALVLKRNCGFFRQIFCRFNCYGIAQIEPFRSDVMRQFNGVTIGDRRQSSIQIRIINITWRFVFVNINGFPCWCTIVLRREDGNRQHCQHHA